MSQDVVLPEWFLIGARMTSRCSCEVIEEHFWKEKRKTFVLLSLLLCFYRFTHTKCVYFLPLASSHADFRLSGAGEGNASEDGGDSLAAQKNVKRSGQSWFGFCQDELLCTFMLYIINIIFGENRPVELFVCTI